MLAPRIGIPAAVLQVALERMGYGVRAARRRGNRRAAADRRHLPRPRSAPQASIVGEASLEGQRMSPPPPSTDVLWFIPTHGDGRYLGTSHGRARTSTSPTCARSPRPPTISATTACCCRPGARCEDAWVVASALVPLTERLRFLVAVRPGLQSPSVAARMAATLRPDLGRTAADQRRHRRRSGRAHGRRPVPRPCAATHVTDEFLRVWRAAAGRRERSTSRASISGSRAASCSSRRCRSPTRRSISAARPRPASRSPPSTSTST